MTTKEVYDKIASHFDKTRFSVWTSVASYLDSFVHNDIILDIGCGNGKNMLYRKDIICKGIDLSSNLVSIAKSKGLDVVEGSMVELPFADETFDGCIAIASYHHLDNDVDRQKALKEMYRVTKKGGRVMIEVWAVEQPIGSKFIFTPGDNYVPWTMKNSDVKELRYYNIYPVNKLKEEVLRLCPQFVIIKEKWESGNWIIELQKN